MKVTEYCVDCQGSGQIVIGEHLITREMALDAGEPQMEGSHFEYEYDMCPYCGDGHKKNQEGKPTDEINGIINYLWIPKGVPLEKNYIIGVAIGLHPVHRICRR